MYEFLLSAAVEASGGWKNEEAMSGPYCFVGSHTFCINSIEKTVKVSIQSVYRRWTSYTPNLVTDALYSEKLLGPMGGHAALQQIMATPGVHTGLIVKANYPWNYTNHEDNSVVLVYYQKEVGQRGPYRAACVKVLGRALTAGEKHLLQEELGVDESNIQGNGINGCGKCWYANPNDDDVYTFTIPPSVMLKGSQDLDYVTIDGAEVKLDTMEGGLKINCKDLIIMGYLERIKRWKQCVGGACSAAEAPETFDQFAKDHADLFADKTELGTDMEISIRGLLSDHLKSSASEVISESSEVVKLLKFAFRFAVHFHDIQNVAKVPFSMIEDIMESQTIEKAEALWQIIESLVEVITQPDIFPKGKLTILRTCNSLLRKLSKSCNTEFCGRVMLFLAAIYPLSEKSALNLPGRMNTNNVTYFENKEEYLANKGILSDSNNDASNGVNEGEDGMEVVVLDGADEASSSDQIGYEMYRAFWNLQSFFASEMKVVDDLTVWRDFSSHCRRVLALFEAHDFSEEELQQAHGVHSSGESKNGAAGGGGAGGGETGVGYSGSKYLTSSQLFALQLRDPTVRQQIAVQILYFIHYLRCKNSPMAALEALPEVSKDMIFLHDQACKLIERSPNDGAQLLAVLRRLLNREVRFIQWKTLGCPEIEISRPVLSEEESAKLAAADLHKASSLSFSLYKKRPALKVKVKRSVNANAAALLAGYQFDHSDLHVKEVARELVKNIPTYEGVIEAYIEAEDPEAGIDEEYHPKKDNLYCWRARRLMAAQHLTVFEAMLDGDLGKGLRKLNNVPEETESSESKTENKENNKMDTDKDGDREAVDNISNSAIENDELIQDKPLPAEEGAGSEAAAARDVEDSAGVVMEESTVQQDSPVEEEIVKEEPAKDVVEEDVAPAAERSTRKRKAT